MNKYMFVSSVKAFLNKYDKSITDETPIRKPKTHYRTGKERFEDKYPEWEYMGVGAMMVSPRRNNDN